MTQTSSSRLACVLLLAVAPLAAACSGGSDSGPDPGTGSCDLKAKNWYTDCSEGCGDVMTCQSFCSSCSAKCYVACETNADCELVGAGSCETSAKGTNRCASAPTKCP